MIQFEVVFINKRVFLFDGLSESETENALCGLNNRKKFQKGEIIYSQYDYVKALGILLKGKAYAVTNNELGLHMKSFSEGTAFGAAAIFGGEEKYVSTVVADGNCEILFISENELKILFSKYNVTAINYIEFLSDKIRFLNSKLAVISCGNAEDTLYNYFLQIKDENGFVTLPKSMTLLAKTLGMSRATLYRNIDALQSNGKIEKYENSVKVV